MGGVLPSRFLTDQLAIGKLIKPFGLSGGIKVKSFSGEMDHFLGLTGHTISLQNGELELCINVMRVEQKGDILVMYFQGYNSPEEVAKIRGYEIWVPRNLAAPLTEGEFYMADLMNCRVEYQGTVVGLVVGYFEGAQMILEIQNSEGAILYIPFISVFVGNIDLHNKCIELLDDRLL